MSEFDVLVFCHILGVVVLAGGAGVGVATGIAMSRTDSVRSIATMSALAERSEHFVVLPGAILTLVTGTWLIADFESFEIGETWLWLSYCLWVVAVGLGEGVLAPFHRRLHQRAAALEAAGVERSAELEKAASARVGSLTGGVLTAVLLVFLYLMVFRPGS